MNALNELLQWCIENKAWLTFNYSPFDGGYKVFVNPGRTMTSAKWYKDLDEAVKACWVALGVKPPYEWVDVKEKTDRKPIDSHAAVGYIAEQTLAPASIISTSNCGLTTCTQTVPKRRGRPPGSKNKPKVTANE